MAERKIDPDLVLPAFLTGNDVKDNHPDFNTLENATSLCSQERQTGFGVMEILKITDES
ncbi:MAG: hypothetical protein ABIH66_00200 [bacterium]